MRFWEQRIHCGHCGNATSYTDIYLSKIFWKTFDHRNMCTRTLKDTNLSRSHTRAHAVFLHPCCETRRKLKRSFPRSRKVRAPAASKLLLLVERECPTFNSLIPLWRNRLGPFTRNSSCNPYIYTCERDDIESGSIWC